MRTPTTTAGRRAPAKPEARTRIAGSDLTPATGPAPGAARAYKYWVGLTPSCPRDYLDVAGINFPKVNELLIDDPTRSGKRRRVPVIGSIVTLDEATVLRMRERLSRLVIRFTDDAGETHEPGAGENVGDAHRRPQRGYPIRIPSQDELDAARASGRPLRAYVPQANDVPAARFMFAVLCDDQERGSRGEFYPDPLETTGLEWPDDLPEPAPKSRRKAAASADDLLST